MDLGKSKYFCNKLPENHIKHTFIIRKEFINEYKIDEQIKIFYPNANIISVEQTTRGSLETALLAEPYIDLKNDAILILDSDIEFRCRQYYDALARNNLKQLDSLKQQRDFWKQEWEEAVARGDSKAAEQFE